MTEAIFWMLIGMLDWSKAGNALQVIEPVIIELVKKNKSDIIKFEEILAQKLYDLDTNPHAKQIGIEGFKKNKYFSGDWFLYSRCVVVANGKDLYNNVLMNPKKFPKNSEFESLLSIGREAYQRKTGMEYNEITKVSYETYSNKAGWK